MIEQMTPLIMMSIGAIFGSFIAATIVYGYIYIYIYRPTMEREIAFIWLIYSIL